MKFAPMPLTVAQSLDEQLTNIELSLCRIESLLNVAVERKTNVTPAENLSIKTGIDKAERLATFTKTLADHLSEK